MENARDSEKFCCDRGWVLRPCPHTLMPNTCEGPSSDQVKEYAIESFSQRMKRCVVNTREEVAAFLAQSAEFRIAKESLRSTEADLRLLTDFTESSQRALRKSYAERIEHCRRGYEKIMEEIIQNHRILVDGIRNEFAKKRFELVSAVDEDWCCQTRIEVQQHEAALKAIQDSESPKVVDINNRIREAKSELANVLLRNQRLESDLFPLEKRNTALKSPSEAVRREIENMQSRILDFDNRIRPDLERIKARANGLREEIEKKEYTLECLIQKSDILKKQNRTNSHVCMAQLEAELSRMKLETVSNADTDTSLIC